MKQQREQPKHKKGGEARRKAPFPGKALAPEENLIYGRNAVAEALKGTPVPEKLWVQDGAEGSIGKILSLAREAGVAFRYVEKQVLDRMAGGGSHQGVVAQVAAYVYREPEEMLALAQERGEDPFLIILDGVEDPHNLGAILRTAECAGAHGVILPKHGAVGVTNSVVKVSAGAASYVPVAKVGNLVQTMERLKEQGLWLAACDMGEQYYYQQELTGPLAIVIGGEGKGVGRLVKEHCDFTLSIPLMGKINSLNASNAAAVVLYEVRRQRDLKG